MCRIRALPRLHGWRDKVALVMGDLKREALAPKWPSHLQVSVDVDQQDLL